MNRLWVPVYGIVVFLVLYVVAASQYGGGSAYDPNAQGFSIVHNYWCDLLAERDYNGAPNPGYRIAFGALVELVLSLCAFWYLAPRLYDQRKDLVFLTRVTGVPSMLLVLLLFTEWHDLAIYVAGAMGIVALLTTLFALGKVGERRLVAVGLVALALALASLASWHSRTLVMALPLVQKTAFLGFFAWVTLVTARVARKERHDGSEGSPPRTVNRPFAAGRAELRGK